MSNLLKFYDFTPIDEQPTVRIPATTFTSSAVAEHLRAPVIFNAAHNPTYRVIIDGEEPYRPLKDIEGAYLLVGKALCHGARKTRILQDDELLYEVPNGSENTP